MEMFLSVRFRVILILGLINYFILQNKSLPFFKKVILKWHIIDFYFYNKKLRSNVQSHLLLEKNLTFDNFFLFDTLQFSSTASKKPFLLEAIECYWKHQLCCKVMYHYGITCLCNIWWTKGVLKPLFHPKNWVPRLRMSLVMPDLNLQKVFKLLFFEKSTFFVISLNICY